jgi:hypothetical protein
MNPRGGGIERPSRLSHCELLVASCKILLSALFRAELQCIRSSSNFVVPFIEKEDCVPDIGARLSKLERKKPALRLALSLVAELALIFHSGASFRAMPLKRVYDASIEESVIKDQADTHKVAYP